MPDDQNPEQTSPATVPFDQAALINGVRSAVVESINGLREETTRQVREVQQQREAANQWAADPVAQTLQPYLAPIVQRTELRAMAAEDKSDFYLSHGEAASHRGDVESVFNQLMTEGRPQPRESIWYFLRGRDPQKYGTDPAIGLAEAARAGASVGGSDMSRPVTPSLDGFRSLPLEKKREAIGNASF